MTDSDSEPERGAPKSPQPEVMGEPDQPSPAEDVMGARSVPPDGSDAMAPHGGDPDDDAEA